MGTQRVTSGGRSRWIGFVVGAAFTFAACGGTGVPQPSPAAGQSPAPAESPALTPTAPPAESGGPEAFFAAVCTATEEMLLAIGNPDTGSASDASKAFDQALASGDPGSIRSTGDAVLGHLAAARAAVATTLGWPPAADTSKELDALLAGISEGVTAMREGGLRGAEADVDDGRTRMGQALQDHFWPSVRLGVPCPPAPGESARTTLLLPSIEEAHRFEAHLPDGRLVLSSATRWGQEPWNAFDARPESVWNAGAHSVPQWIEIDLGRPSTIRAIRLLIAQALEGETVHQVTVRGPSGSDQLLTEFRGITRDGQLLESTLEVPLDKIRFVRVTTLKTPALVSWREIEIITEAE